MNEQEKRDKVSEGLECCFLNCTNPDACPYKKYKGSCEEELLGDALELVKRQEPRLLPLNEARALKEGTDIWIEKISVGGDIWIYAMTIWWIYDNCLSGYGGPADLPWSAYGKWWRIWTLRPSDAQREATPWQ